MFQPHRIVVTSLLLTFWVSRKAAIKLVQPPTV